MTSTKPERTPQDADKFIVRLPQGMRDRIADAAKAGGRSMNSEIVSRLERSFNPIADEGDVLRAVHAITEYSAQFGVVVTVQFSRPIAGTFADAVASGVLPPDATEADMTNPGPAIVRMQVERTDASAAKRKKG